MKKILILFVLALPACFISCNKEKEGPSSTEERVSIIGTWQSYYYYEVQFSHVVYSSQEVDNFTISFTENKVTISGYSGGTIEGKWEFDKEDSSVIVFPSLLVDTEGESSYVAAAKLENTTLQIQICNIYDDITSGYLCYKVK